MAPTSCSAFCRSLLVGLLVAGSAHAQTYEFVRRSDGNICQTGGVIQVFNRTWYTSAVLVAEFQYSATTGVYLDWSRYTHDMSDTAAGSRPAYVAGSLDFDGVDDEIHAIDQAWQNFGDGSSRYPRTVMCWAKSDAWDGASGLNMLITKDSSTTRGWLFLCTSGSPRLVLFDPSAGGYIGRSAPAISTNAWHHIAATYAAGTTSASIMVYVDGVRSDNADVASGSFTACEDDGNRLTVAFRDPTGGVADYFFNGRLDGVRIYDRVLSSNEVYAISRVRQ